MKKIAVFCGASSGFDPVYTQEAKKMGKILTEKGISVIFGGGKVGMMGALADEILSLQGDITGIIPHFLRHEEVEHDRVKNMLVSKGMSDRKITISKMVDGYIAMPGGFGTLDEVMEVLTLGQLHIEQKPIGFLNTKGFFNPLIQQFDLMVKEGFLKQENRDMVLIDENPERLLKKMENYIPPKVSKMIDTVATIKPSKK